MQSPPAAAEGPVAGGIAVGDARSAGGWRLGALGGRLRTERGRFVANRETWRVADVLDDDSVVADSFTRRGRVTLPPAYVREHTELAYATTGHGAQGRTVDVSRALITARTALAGLYVAMSRGAEANHACVTLDDPDTEAHGPQPEVYSAFTGFAAAIGHNDRQLSAIDRLATELDAIDSPQGLEALRENAVRQALEAAPARRVAKHRVRGDHRRGRVGLVS